MLVVREIGCVEGWGTFDFGVHPRPRDEEVERPLNLVTVFSGKQGRGTDKLALRFTWAPDFLVNPEWKAVDWSVFVTKGFYDTLMTWPEGDSSVGVLQIVLEKHP